VSWRHHLRFRDSIGRHPFAGVQEREEKICGNLLQWDTLPRRATLIQGQAITATHDTKTVLISRLPRTGYQRRQNNSEGADRKPQPHFVFWSSGYSVSFQAALIEFCLLSRRGVADSRSCRDSITITERQRCGAGAVWRAYDWSSPHTPSPQNRRAKVPSINWRDGFRRYNVSFKEEG
jgi:hypothetical protein